MLALVVILCTVGIIASVNLLTRKQRCQVEMINKVSEVRSGRIDIQKNHHDVWVDDCEVTGAVINKLRLW